MMTWLTVTGALLTCAGLIQPQVQRRRIGRGASIPAASSERTRSHPRPRERCRSLYRRGGSTSVGRAYRRAWSNFLSASRSARMDLKHRPPLEAEGLAISAEGGCSRVSP